MSRPSYLYRCSNCGGWVDEEDTRLLFPLCRCGEGAVPVDA